MNDYEGYLDRTALDIRNDLATKIREAVSMNQECYMAYWIKQNPDVDLKDYVLVHGIKGNQYTFTVELKEKYDAQN